jgi:hypothetical protein
LLLKRSEISAMSAAPSQGGMGRWPVSEEGAFIARILLRQ